MNQALVLLSPVWILEFVRFLAASLALLVLPGYAWATLTGTKGIVRLGLSLPLGIAALSSVAFITGHLGIRNVVSLYVLLGIYQGLKHWKTLQKDLYAVVRKMASNRWLLAIMILGSILQLTVVFASGSLTKDGIVLYQINAHDGIFHAGLIQSLVNHFPPVQPGADGLEITNYHFLSNLILAEIVRWFHVPILASLFQFLPLLMAFGYALIILALSEMLMPKHFSRFAIWFSLLHYFAGDFIYWAYALLNGNWQWSLMSFDNGAIQYLNPPQAMAKLVFFAGIIVLLQVKRNTSIPRVKDIVFLSLLTATLIGLKVYFSLVFLMITGLIAIQSIFKKPQRTTIASWFLCLFAMTLAAAVLYLPTNSQAGGLFLAPFAWPKLFIAPAHLNWDQWWLKQQVFEEARNFPRLILQYASITSLFILSVGSIKLVGFIALLSRSPHQLLIRSLALASGICYLIAIMFLQTSGEYNIFNFLIVANTCLTILLALFITKTKQFSWLLSFLLLVGITLSAPRTLYVAYSFMTSWHFHQDVTVVSHEHIKAFNWLSRQSSDAPIITHLNNYWDYQAPYTSFFSDKPCYYCSRLILQSHNQPINDRQTFINTLYSQVDASSAADLVESVGAQHYLLLKDLGPQQPFFPKLNGSFLIEYESDAAVVLRARPINQRIPASFQQTAPNLGWW